MCWLVDLAVALLISTLLGAVLIAYGGQKMLWQKKFCTHGRLEYQYMLNKLSNPIPPGNKTYPTLGKGKSSTQRYLGYVSSQQDIRSSGCLEGSDLMERLGYF